MGRENETQAVEQCEDLDGKPSTQLDKVQPRRLQSKKGRCHMHESIGKLAAAAMTCACLFVFSVGAHAVNLNVYCGGRGLTSVNAALKLLNPSVPNTLTISGTCKENVLIQGFNRLTLTGRPGATINDASGGTGFVVDVEDSPAVSIQNLTIKGGSLGVQCSMFSVCHFDGNTVQGASIAGIQVVQSRATFGVNTIQNNGTGLVCLESSSCRTFGGLIIQQNQGDGVNVSTNGSFATFGDTIQNNGNNGIASYNHGSLLLLGTTVTGNSATGVFVVGQSAAVFAGSNVVTGNAYGVFVRDVSYAEFSGDTMTGNWTGMDVYCQPQFPATRGALTNIGGGITNCVEP